MDTLNHSVTIGFLLTAIVLGCLAVILFWFVPKNIGVNQKRIVKHFILFFAFATSTFIAHLILHGWVPKALTSTLNSILYLSAIYALRHGLLLRKKPEYKSLFHNRFFIFNLVCLGVLEYILHSFHPHFYALAVSILNFNIIAVMMSSLAYLDIEKRGEIIVRYAVISTVCLLALLTSVLHIERTASYYPIFVLANQVITFFIWLGVLFSLLLSDIIEKHYINSMTDSMTGLHNRRFFIENTNALIANKNEKFNDEGDHSSHKPFASLITCDIDNFKAINDDHGHEMGDRVICDFARILKSVTRKQDVVSRIGGEEFALFLPETDEKTALMIANRLRESTHRHYINGISYTASFGVTSAPIQSHTQIDFFLRHADKAMYRAKHKGRNTVCVFKPQLAL